MGHYEPSPSLKRVKETATCSPKMVVNTGAKQAPSVVMKLRTQNMRNLDAQALVGPTNYIR